MSRIRVSGFWLLAAMGACAALPAGAESGAWTGGRPLLAPTHPVTIDYLVTTRDGGTIDVHVAILAGGARLRVTSPELPTMFLVDRAAGIAQVVLPVLRAYSTVDIRKYDPEQHELRAAVFTHRGQSRIAGRACTQWQASSPEGSGSACITADGILLEGELTSARHGAVARVIASRVQDGAPPPGEFDVPEGFSESPFRLDPKGFGR